MYNAVIVDAVRTPCGKNGGKLKDWHPAKLGAHVLQALAARNPIDPELIDDVIFGCVMQVGPQTLNVARNSVLTAGWPETVPATTVDRQCGSSQQAIHFAAQGVMSGAYDAVVAGGVENMSQVPLGSSISKDMPFPFPPEMLERYSATGLPHQGIGAEMIADEWGFSRADLDAFGALSQQRAERAAAEGRFEREIVAVRLETEDGEESMRVDEGIRPGTTAEKLAGLKSAFKEDGKLTAGNSSQIADGASALLIMNEEKAKAQGLRPRARFHAFALAGTDPVTMLKGPIPATFKILEKSGLWIDDIDLFEVNEAFASVVLAWQKETGADMDRVNVNGGAIALGHPLGATGGKLMATLLCELERTGGRYGMQIMCEGGGLANATIIERI
ncbi:MAG: thiolase family protein [Deltaproteobacteria bacterium]|jgi:acetyl-CoA acyltransferase|nr:thiolase family protein [Deltaproteobacteria bacterium]MBW2543386.1 thiolase family protein [Deltaproteobacteria bacterium]